MPEKTGNQQKVEFPFVEEELEDDDIEEELKEMLEEITEQDDGVGWIG